MDKEIHILDWIRNNDNRGYKYLYEHYFGTMFFVAKSFHIREEDIHDLIQNVFIALGDASAVFENELKLRVYLYTALKNECRNYLKHSKVKDAYHSYELSVGKEEYSFWEKVMEEEVYSIIHDAVALLPDRQRMVIQLHLKGLKNKEIADELHLDEETVKSYKKEAKKKLQLLLEPYKNLLTFLLYL